MCKFFNRISRILILFLILNYKNRLKKEEKTKKTKYFLRHLTKASFFPHIFIFKKQKQKSKYNDRNEQQYQYNKH